jgi:hypothetical protein
MASAKCGPRPPVRRARARADSLSWPLLSRRAAMHLFSRATRYRKLPPPPPPPHLLTRRALGHPGMRLCRTQSASKLAPTTNGVAPFVIMLPLLGAVYSSICEPVCVPAHACKIRLVEISDVENRTGAKIVARESTGEALASSPGYEGNRGERDGSKVQEEGMLRTKPGRGEATRSMSCSDKIARWNVRVWPRARQAAAEESARASEV